MIDFDLIDINEAIDGLSYEEKLEYLKEREDEINDAMEELKTHLSDIEEIKDEIEEEHQKELQDKVLLDLHNAGYPLELDSNGNISFSLGKAKITISLACISEKMNFCFESSGKQLSYRKLICSLLPNFKQDVNVFYRQVAEEEISTCVVDVVSKLMNNKQQFEEIQTSDTMDMIKSNEKLKESYPLIEERIRNLNLCILTIQGFSSPYQIDAKNFLELANYLEEDKLTDKSWENLWNNHLHGLLFEHLQGLPNADEELHKLYRAYSMEEEYKV